MRKGELTVIDGAISRRDENIIDLDIIDLADDEGGGDGGDDGDDGDDDGWENPSDVVCHRQLESGCCVGAKCALFDRDENRCLDVLVAERQIYYMDSIIEALNRGGAEAVSAILLDLAKRKGQR